MTMPLCRHCLAGFVLLLAAFAISAEEAAPPEVMQLVPTLKTWGTNSILISAVRAQNAKGMTLDQIKAKDKEWMAATGVDAFMKTLMNNDAAKEMLKLERSAPYYLEFFLMDNQGANVAMTNKTSDYWQGDEAKFKESFKGGVGAVHVGPVKFDSSAQAYLVQVSVPVMDGEKAIGALTIGINLDELEK